jgi:uncharacterized membrane protein YphA (DoxX/SURF4 family)
MNAVLHLLRNPRVVLVAQIWIGVVFLAAALGKISDPAAFAKQIHYFRLLPGGFENTVAIMLPWIELIAALSLLLRAHPRSGGIVTAGLMAMFVVVVAAALARGLDIECGCFGTSDASRVGTAKLLENLGLLALAGIASLKSGSRLAPEPVAEIAARETA